jgi:cobalt-zinc-cadmium efflux system outer membrane protein
VSYQPRPLTPADTAHAWESRSLSDPGLRAYLEANGVAGEWPLRAWDFRSLSLAAFYFHPDLDVARAKWGVARAALTTAGERPNPSVTFTPGYNSTTPLTPVSPWILGLGLDVPVETAGKRGKRIEQALHNAGAARFNIASVAWQIRAQLRQALLELAAARDSDSLLGAHIGLQSSILSILERQMDAGAVSQVEVSPARIALANARIQLQEAHRQAAEARIRVALTVGLPPGALDGVKIGLDDLAVLPRELPAIEMRRRAVLNRADLLGALADYDAAEAAMRLEVSRQFPDIHFSPGYQLDQANNKWQLGWTVSIPVLNQNRGPIGEAEARRRESEARFTALQARVLGEVEAAVISYSAATEKLAAAARLETETGKRIRSIQAMLQAGEVDRLALATAQLESSTIALASLDAVVKARQALARLEDAIQSPVQLPANIQIDPRSEFEPTSAR